MDLDGTVADMNLSRGMIAVQTRGYGFAIFELLGGGEIQVGDSLHWDAAERELVNTDTGERISAMLQNYGVGPSGLHGQLLRQ